MSLYSHFMLPLGTMLMSTLAVATTPAPWLQDYSSCLGVESDREMASIQRPLSRSEARQIAARIVTVCEPTVPHDFSGRDRVKFENSARADLARRIMYTSGSR